MTGSLVVAVREEGIAVGKDPAEAIEGDGAEEVHGDAENHQHFEEPGELPATHSQQHDQEDDVVEAEAIAELLETGILVKQRRQRSGQDG